MTQVPRDEAAGENKEKCNFSYPPLLSQRLSHVGAQLMLAVHAAKKKEKKREEVAFQH